jgi:hypothetical protein
MATAPTAGYFYFVESTAGLEDWITDHAGDPDNIDLSLMTEGTHYCKLEMPMGFQKNFVTGVKVIDMVGGKSVDTRWQKRAYQVLANGIETSYSNANTIDKFVMSDRHTAGDTATFKRYYLVGYFGTNNHVLFTDASGTQQSYCKGIITNGSISWVGRAPQTAIVKLNFRSIW